MAEFRNKKRKKICHMCAGKTVNYKDINIITKYISETGKILPRRFTGTCAKHQRKVTEAIKRARTIALLPFTVAFKPETLDKVLNLADTSVGLLSSLNNSVDFISFGVFSLGSIE